MKPLGIFSPHAGIPLWASFALLSETHDFGWAREFAAGRMVAGKPFVWVLYLEGPDAHTPVAQWAPEIRDRLVAAGVLPYVAAVAYREEWYANDNVSSVERIDATHAWVSAQHAEVKRLFPAQALLSIEEFVTPRETRWAPAYYRPEFAHVDLRTVYAYVRTGETWDGLLLDAKIAFACGDTVAGMSLPKKPVVFIPRAFRHGEHAGWSAWPMEADDRRAEAWARRHEIIAAWPFDWADRPHVKDFQGWQSWPGARPAAWGVR